MIESQLAVDGRCALEEVEALPFKVYGSGYIGNTKVRHYGLQRELNGIQAQSISLLTIAPFSGQSYGALAGSYRKVAGYVASI